MNDEKFSFGNAINTIHIKKAAEREVKKGLNKKKAKPIIIKRKPNFIIYDKKRLFATKSLFIFNEKSSFREKIIKIHENKYFEHFITIIIILNTFALILNDYSFRIYPENKYLWRNQTGNYLEYFFNAIFLGEFILKVIGMGFVFEQGTYLRDGWNIIDFVVVITGIIAFFPGQANLSAIRTVRMLRPLRGIKVLVKTLISSLPALGNVVIFLFFIMILFAILGVQLFSGIFEYRCRVTPAPVNGSWPIVENSENLCGNCPNGGFCGAWIKYNLKWPKNEEVLIENLNWGINNFDNVLTATLTIFQVITTEGWSTLVEIFCNAYPNWIIYFYFCALILFGNFFIMNLILAVVNDAFINSKDQIKIEQETHIESAGNENIQVANITENLKKLETRDGTNDQTIKNKSFSESEKNKGITEKLHTLNEVKKDHEESPTQTNQKIGSLNIKNSNIIPIKIDNFDKLASESLELKENSQKNEEDDPEDNRMKLRVLKRAKKFKIYKFFAKISLSKKFLMLTTIFILMNTIVLALDKYPISKKEESNLETANLVFSIFFLVEMVIKLCGLGPREYIRDKMNIFDGIIVLSSIIEWIVKATTENNSNNLSVIAAFRALRIFRIFKLARSWTSLRNLLKAITMSFSGIVYFCILLILFMTVVSLLGMEFFAYRVRLNENGLPTRDPKQGESPRSNFDNFWNAMVTIFILLTTEDWNAIMYAHVLGTNAYSAAIFFVIVVVIGNFVLLNLFLAMLINNFHDSKQKVLETQQLQKKSSVNSQNYAMRFISHIKSKIKKNNKKNVNFEKSISDTFSQNLEDAKNKFPIQAAESFENAFKSNRSEIPLKDDFKITLENCQDLKEIDIIDISPKRANNINNIEIFNTPKNNNYFYDEDSPYSARRYTEEDSPNERFSLEINKKSSNQSMFLKRGLSVKKKTSSENSRDNMKIRTSIRDPFELIDKKSLYVFDKDNKVRRLCVRMCSHKYFDWFILGVIIVSSILLACNDPLVDPNSKGQRTLKILDYIITSIFVIEMLIKIISFGFIINGKNSYLCLGWNILDFLIVMISLISYGVEASSSKNNLSYLKILRILRVLRPLRLISRNEGLKLAINSLFGSIPNILNLLLVCSIFFFLFGIIGVNYFKGSFFYCDTGNFQDVSAEINNRRDCMDFGGDWVNKDTNFDNILESVVSLFIICSTESWVGMMQDGIDARGIHLNPKRDYNPFWAIFYILFIIVGSLIIINLYTGIVCESFDEEHSKLCGWTNLTDEQLEWVMIQKRLLHVSPEKHINKPTNRFRKICYNISLNPKFEYFIMWCIIVNVFFFLLKWHRQPKGLEIAMEVINYIFFAIFIMEAFIKISGLGWCYYRSGWNCFDFAIVSLTLISLILEKANVFSNIGSSTSVKRAESLRTIFMTLIKSLPALANVGALLGLMLFIYAVLGNSIFPYVMPKDSLTERLNFSTFGNSIYLLFVAATGDGWNAIMADISRKQSPNYPCLHFDDFFLFEKYGKTACGKPFGLFFMISFQMILAMILLNLFIAIILQTFDETQKAEKGKIKSYDLEDFVKYWSVYSSPEAYAFIHPSEFTHLMETLEKPLGFNKMILTEYQKRLEISNMLLPIYRLKSHINPLKKNNYYFFYDVLYELCRRYLTLFHENKALENEKENLRGYRIINRERRRRTRFFIKEKQAEMTTFSSADVTTVGVIYERVFKKIHIFKEKIRIFRELKRKEKENQEKIVEIEELDGNFSIRSEDIELEEEEDKFHLNKEKQQRYYEVYQGNLHLKTKSLGNLNGKDVEVANKNIVENNENKSFYVFTDTSMEEDIFTKSERKNNNEQKNIIELEVFSKSEQNYNKNINFNTKNNNNNYNINNNTNNTNNNNNNNIDNNIDNDNNNNNNNNKDNNINITINNDNDNINDNNKEICESEIVTRNKDESEIENLSFWEGINNEENLQDINLNNIFKFG